MEYRQDFNSSPELNHPFFEIFCIAFMALAWGIFVLSAKSYLQTDWFYWLYYSRIGMSATGVALILLIISKKLYSYNLSSWYLLLSVAIQASHGYFEDSNSVEFYNFIGIIFVLACLSYNGLISKWLKHQLPFYIIFFLLPLSSKDPIFFASISKFIDSFSLMISGLIIGIGILKISSSRYSYIIKYLESKEQIINLTYEVAHDIRSPVSALKIALNDFQLGKPEGDIVRFSLLRIDEIANNLLRHKKANNFNTPPQSFTTDLENLIKEKELLCGSNIKFKINTCSKIPHLNFSNYQGRLISVISNLLNNSIESLENNMGSIEISFERQDSNILVSISDNGKGIPPEVLRDFQFNSFSFNKVNGNGIGLKHARQFLKHLNGELTVESIIDVGTKVNLRIPATIAIV